MNEIRYRLYVDHEELATGDEDWDGYHEWLLTNELVKLDKRGHPNPRMYSANWAKIVCNNSDCAGLGYVNIQDVAAALDPAW